MRGLAARGWTLSLCLFTACGLQPEPPAFSEAQSLAGVDVPAATLEQGRGLYLRYCASCHGPEGGGDGAAARQLPAQPRDLRAGNFRHASADPSRRPSHEELREFIKRGLPAQGMPAWKGLRDEDLDAVARFVETLSPVWRR